MAGGFQRGAETVGGGRNLQFLFTFRKIKNSEKKIKKIYLKLV